MEKQLIDNLYLSNDTADIIDFMADHEIMPASFDKSVAITYIDKQDFNLILFLKNAEKDEFLKFRFSDFSRHAATFPCLNQVFEQLIQNDPLLYAAARAKLEEMYYMIPVFRAYYYGKYDETKEESYI